MLSGTTIPAEQRTFSLETVLVLLGAIAVAGCILVPKAGLVIAIGCVAVWFVTLVGEALHGRIEGILLWWAAALPLGGYFLSFPREHSIVTLDRVVQKHSKALFVLGNAGVRVFSAAAVFEHVGCKCGDKEY